MPSFCSPGVMKWRDLIINLVSKEIKIRYMGATLGFVWSLGNPLVVTLTYYTVFTYILPSSQDRFALHLVTGVVHWMLLAQIVSQSGEWLINNGNLIRKLRFPVCYYPCPVRWQSLFSGPAACSSMHRYLPCSVASFRVRCCFIRLC